MPVNDPLPMHPGEVLEEVYMKDYRLTHAQLAEKLGCTLEKINEIVNGKRSITPEFALQLEKLFGLKANVWTRMQDDYDVWQTRRKTRKIKRGS